MVDIFAAIQRANALDTTDWPEGTVSDATDQVRVDVHDLAAEVLFLREALRVAEAWKREALAVEQSWDPQAIAKVLGLRLGADKLAASCPECFRVYRDVSQLNFDDFTAETIRMSMAEKSSTSSQ